MRLQIFDFLSVYFLLLLKFIHVRSIKEDVWMANYCIVLQLWGRFFNFLFYLFVLRWYFNFNTFNFDHIFVIKRPILLFLNFIKKLISFLDKWLILFLFLTFFLAVKYIFQLIIFNIWIIFIMKIGWLQKLSTLQIDLPYILII